MAVIYRLDRENALIRTRCVGDVTFEEVLDHFQELASDTSLPEHLDVLLDLSDSRTVPQSDQVRTIAGEIDRLQREVEWGACAVVASRDAMFGMSRVFQVFTEAYFDQSDVFRTLEEAERWLASVRAPAT